MSRYHPWFFAMGCVVNLGDDGWIGGGVLNFYNDGWTGRICYCRCWNDRCGHPWFYGTGWCVLYGRAEEGC